MAGRPTPVSADAAASVEGASQHTTLYSGRKASHPLHILIVGCGMGGLAAAHCLGKAGHKVTLFETAAAIGEVGAGIQITPNLSRLLRRWGAGSALEAVGVRPEAIVLRRYATGERVGYTRWTDMEEKYGSPYYHIHRADLHKLLFDLAAPYMTLRLKSNVVGVDPDAPSVTLGTGEVVHGDLIIGADGVKSLVQRVVLGHTNPAEPTGDAVYRAIVPSHLLLADPELRELVDVPEMTGWMGPRRHIMAYNIVSACICSHCLKANGVSQRAKNEYNFVLAHPDDGSVESWTAEGSADKMRADFADFEPRCVRHPTCLSRPLSLRNVSDLTNNCLSVRKILSFIDSTLKWRLMDRKPLKTWIHASHRVILLGDACHPMLVRPPHTSSCMLTHRCLLCSRTGRKVLQWPSRTRPCWATCSPASRIQRSSSPSCKRTKTCGCPARRRPSGSPG